MADYRPEHSELITEMRSVGAPVTFGSGKPSQYDAATDTWGSVTEGSVVGFAVEMPSTVEEYADLSLRIVDPIVLQFVPQTFGQSPRVGDVIFWAGKRRTVKEVRYIRPSGDTIASRVIVS